MNELMNDEHKNRMIARIAGILVLSLGATVLFGWYTTNEMLIQVFPSFAPMQYNTALAFLLSGAGLIAHSLKIRSITFLCGLFVFAVGFATLIQYIFGIDLGIDQASMEHYITVQTSHPGRMAPNTALCFLLSGLILLLSVRSAQSRRDFILKRVLILTSTALAIVALLGYLSQVETAYGWSSLTRMAVHTSFGFIVLSAGLLVTTFRGKIIFKELNASHGWITFAGVAVTMMVAVSLSLEFEKNETKRIRAELEQESIFIRSTLEGALASRFLDLRRMAQRREFLRGAPEDERRAEVRKYLNRGADLLAVGHSDLALEVNWIDRLREDVSTDEIKKTIAGGRAELRRIASVQIADGGLEPFGIMSGHGQYVTFLPIYLEGEAEGLIIGVFDLDVLVTTELSKDYFNRHGVSLYRDGELVFESAKSKGDNAARWGVTDALDFYDINWGVKVWPKQEFLQNVRSSLRFVVLGVGLLFSGIFVLMYRYSEAERLVTRERARDAAFLEAVLNNVSDGIVACDAKGALSLFNQSAKNFHGLDAKATAAQELAQAYDLYEPDGKTALATENIPLIQAYNGTGVYGQEMIISPKGLPRRTIIANAATLYGAEGEKIGAVATMRDVTVERSSAAIARRREKELQLIFDNVPIRLWLKDDKNGIVRLNKSAADSMGVSVEDAEGASTYDLFPEQAKKYHDDDLQVLNSGKPLFGIVEEYTPSAGQRGWVRTDKVPYFDETTGQRNLFVASTDITKQMEDSEELQRSNAALEQFARVASHDLQEPLRKLTIFSGFLEEDLGGEIPEKAKADLEAITSSAERMRNLVKDMLSLSRIRAEGLLPEPVNPNDCIAEAMTALSQQCRDLRAVVLYDELPPVMAEPTLLTQVYQNLAGNALKFTAPGRAPSVKFSAEQSGNDIILSVEDNGIGIDENDTKRIFEPLTRLHSRDAYEGTGIGLAICKRTIETFGGRIWVEKSPAGGACFKFSLKRAKAIETAA